MNGFWRNHDPTKADRPGTRPETQQYRSAIFYHTPAQKATAEASKQRLEAAGVHAGPVMTRIVPAGVFWRAEEYHQRYMEKQGLSTCKAM